MTASMGVRPCRAVARDSLLRGPRAFRQLHGDHLGVFRSSSPPSRSSGRNTIQGQTELHHGDRHFRLTITVSAPRNLVVSTMVRSVRVANDSMRSSTDMSMMTPSDLQRPTFSATSSSRRRSRGAQVRLNARDEHVLLLENRNRHLILDLRLLDRERVVVETYDLVAELALCLA